MPQGGGCPTPRSAGRGESRPRDRRSNSPTDYFTTASGTQQLSDCGLPILGGGYFNAQPNFSFFLSGMQEYGRLEIEGEASCDNRHAGSARPTASGNFDDDSNGNLNPLIDLTNTAALNGQVDVWVGPATMATSCPRPPSSWSDLVQLTRRGTPTDRTPGRRLPPGGFSVKELARLVGQDGADDANDPCPLCCVS